MKSKEDITMAFQINDGCVMCGACAGACPVGAISEGDGFCMYLMWSMCRNLPNRCYL